MDRVRRLLPADLDLAVRPDGVARPEGTRWAVLRRQPGLSQQVNWRPGAAQYEVWRVPPGLEVRCDEIGASYPVGSVEVVEVFPDPREAVREAEALAACHLVHGS